LLGMVGELDRLRASSSEMNIGPNGVRSWHALAEQPELLSYDIAAHMVASNCDTCEQLRECCAIWLVRRTSASGLERTTTTLSLILVVVARTR
jgi:hypothetical protein